MKGHNFDHGCGDICKKCGKIHKAWNGGLTKETDERVRKMGEEISKVVKGRPSWKKGLTMEMDSRIKSGWMKGLTKETDERVRRHAESITGDKHPMYGKHFSEDHRKKIGIKMQEHWDDPEFRERMEEIHQSQEFRDKSRVTHTDEAIEKIRAANLGRKRSPETRARISISKTGEKNPSWRGGISFEPYGPEFNNSLKKQIRRRDGNICQFPSCVSTYRLAVHHIDYDKRNNDPLNLIALCIGHNFKVNFNRDRWTEYFQDLQERRWS